LQDVPGHFVFNADESGFWDLVDPCEKLVVVPAMFSSDLVSIRAKRLKNHATMVAISSDGEIMD
jgi:hypothetical protein